MLFFLFLLHLNAYLQFANNRFKCHQKWLTAEMFSLPETPKVGGNHFGFTSVCLRASAWNFHGAVDENSMKIWLWVIHLWIGWILTGNKNTGECWGKRCWTLGEFILSCKRWFLLGRMKCYTHTEMVSCVNKTVWVPVSFAKLFANSFIMAVWTLKGKLYLKKKFCEGGQRCLSRVANMSQLKYWNIISVKKAE